MRLDNYLHSHLGIQSRSRAATLIKSGDVQVNNTTVYKTSYQVKPDDHVTVTDSIGYVSRAGIKLAYGLEQFGLVVAGRRCLDIGSSTGGFSQVLLQAGAGQVVAVDVGTDQMDSRVSSDPRLELHEQTDVRDFHTEQPFDVVVVDVSFIPLALVAEQVASLLVGGGDAVVLIKPQFELGRAYIGKGGIAQVEEYGLGRLVGEVDEVFAEYGLERQAEVLESPIKGGEGNVEYLGWYRKTLEG